MKTANSSDPIKVDINYSHENHDGHGNKVVYSSMTIHSFGEICSQSPQWKAIPAEGWGLLLCIETAAELLTDPETDEDYWGPDCYRKTWNTSQEFMTTPSLEAGIALTYAFNRDPSLSKDESAILKEQEFESWCKALKMLGYEYSKEAYQKNRESILIQKPDFVPENLDAEALGKVIWPLLEEYDGLSVVEMDLNHPYDLVKMHCIFYKKDKAKELSSLIREV